MNHLTKKERAYTALVEECGITIAHFCRACYPSDEYLSQDLYAKILLVLWEKFPLFRGESSLSTWAYRVAVNTARNHHRQLARRPVTVSIDSLSKPLVASTEDDNYTEEQYENMYRLISRLEPRERVMLSLYFDGHTSAEMAAILGISATNVTTRLNRIRNKLKKMHNNETDEP